MSEIRAASTGKTGKTTVLPGFLAGKTWSYLDFQKEVYVLSRKAISRIFSAYFPQNDLANIEDILDQWLQA